MQPEWIQHPGICRNDRIGRFEDPWGHRWAVATHVEDVSPEELAKRTEAMGG